MGIGAEAR